MWETWVRSLGWEDPLEKEMATHSSILAWRIPWTEELGGLQSTGRKELDTTERLHFHLSFIKGASVSRSVISDSFDPVDCSPPSSSVCGILQARILEWFAMPSSAGSSQPSDQTQVFYVSYIGRRALYD